MSPVFLSAVLSYTTIFSCNDSVPHPRTLEGIDERFNFLNYMKNILYRGINTDTRIVAMATIITISSVVKRLLLTSLLISASYLLV